MASYVVMEPPRGLAAERAETAVLVRDGFAFLAFLLPTLWLLVHRLWLEAGAAFAAALLVGALAGMLGSPLAGTAASLALSVFFGLEANGLRINALRRRGWREWGTVDARTHAEAETRYAYAARLDDMPAPAPAPAMDERFPAGQALLFGAAR